MTRLAQIPEASTPNEPCVWMEAGLLAYRLCDRGFDCAHCPLDAALRGRTRESARAASPLPARTPAVEGFPDDRRYTEGHLWARPSDENRSRVRFGFDGFAATIVDPPVGVRRTALRRALAEGEPACGLACEGGVVTIGVPIAGRVVAWNPALSARPELVCADPYGEGWIGEVMATRASDADRLADADEARDRAGLDARRFRRQVALRLLAQADAPPFPCEGEWIHDIRRLVGAGSFFEVIRDLVY